MEIWYRAPLSVTHTGLELTLLALEQEWPTRAECKSFFDTETQRRRVSSLD